MKQLSKEHKRRITPFTLSEEFTFRIPVKTSCPDCGGVNCSNCKDGLINYFKTEKL